MSAEDEDVRAKVARRIAEVRAKFLANLRGRSAELSALARAAGDPADADAGKARDALRLGLHNLVGAAPTLGLQALGRRAAELEARVMSSPALGAGGLDAATAEALARDIESLADVES